MNHLVKSVVEIKQHHTQTVTGVIKQILEKSLFEQHQLDPRKDLLE